MHSGRRRFLKTSAAAGAAAVLSPRLRLLADQLPASKLAADPLRPQYHLLPPGQWMNDPNGPVYWQGRYHLFYQLNPHDSVWGDMHWGHAVSPDMIHWRHLPVAMSPTPGGPDAEGVFSGSIVQSDGKAYALYTGISNSPMSEATLKDPRHPYKEQQCLRASSDPMLERWSAPEVVIARPPLPIATIGGFRDPAPWRDGDQWYMVVGSGVMGKGGMALLYRSTDLHNWEYLHPLAEGPGNGKNTPDTVDSGDMWECPDFFALGNKHVLLYSTERKVYWQTGEFDKKELRFHKQKEGMLDYGAFYAPKSQLDAHGNRILWGWINETRPEAEFKAAGWAGCMSLPRVLTVGPDGSLRMLPATETSSLIPSRPVSAMQNACGVIRWTLTDAGPWQSTVTDAGEREFFSWKYNPADGILSIGDKQLPMAGNLYAKGLKLETWIDGSVVEVFANGQSCAVLRVYRAPQGGLTARGSSSELYPCKPISTDRMTTT